MPESESKFDRAVARAVAAHHAFAAAEAEVRRGLSKEAFLKEAKSNANVSDKDLSELHKTLGGPGFEAAMSGVNAVARSFIEPGIHASRPQKRVKYFWDDPGRAALGAAGATEMAGYALGVKLAVSLHPEAFGQLATWETGLHAMESAQQELADAIAAIEVNWAADDIQVAEDGRCVFKRFPSVTLTSIDLAARLLDAALKTPSGETARQERRAPRNSRGR